MGCGASAIAPEIDESAPPVIDIASMFGALDTDGDGFVTLEELTSYLKDRGRSQAEIETLFKLMDKDGDGKVTQEEAAAAVTESEGGPSPLEDLMAERPAPSAAVFDELLNKAKTPVTIDLVEERAITLKQLGLAFKHAASRCRKEGWLGKKQGPDGRWNFKKLTPMTINLYDLCAHVIMPATHRTPLASTDNVFPSYVELVADGAQPPDYFVSHYWGEAVLDFIVCLRQHSIDREVGGGKACVYLDQKQGRGQQGATVTLGNKQIAGTGMGKRNSAKPWEPIKQPHTQFAQMPKAGDKAKYWVCAYANRQWNLGGDVTEDPSQSSFHRAIRRSKGTVAILDSAGTYWSRIWCDYEVYVALEGAHEERYTFDVYTACQGVLDQCSFMQADKPPLFCEAVGLTDGLCAGDEKAMYPSLAGMMKLRREANFPAFQQRKGLQVQLQNGDASMDSDKTHILNAIAGNSADSAALNATPPDAHPAFDAVNGKLSGRIASQSFVSACFRGDVDFAEKVIAAIANPASKLTELRLNFATIEPGDHRPEPNPTHQAMLSKLVAVLPETLEVLHIEMTPSLADLSELVTRCPRLREISLNGCVNLTSLPDLSPLAPTLKVLKLTSCDLLVKNKPDVSKLSLTTHNPPSDLKGFQKLMIAEMLEAMMPGMPKWMAEKAAPALLAASGFGPKKGGGPGGGQGMDMAASIKWAE